eukprot:SAG11_NODE_10014_length_862_cov_2.304063_1_plen_129_part_00
MKRYPYRFTVTFQYWKRDPKMVGGTVLGYFLPADADVQDFQNRQGLACCPPDLTAEKISKIKNSTLRHKALSSLWRSVETLPIQALILDEIWWATYEFCFEQINSKHARRSAVHVYTVRLTAMVRLTL